MRPHGRRRARDVHVFRDAESRAWIVASRGRSSSRHRSQRTAVEAATRAAEGRHVDLVVHGRDGRIRSKDSFGNESPRRDREH